MTVDQVALCICAAAPPRCSCDHILRCWATITALQKRQGVQADGYCGPITVTAWQSMLNHGQALKMANNIPTPSNDAQDSQPDGRLSTAGRASTYPLTAALYALVKIAAALGWVPAALRHYYELVSAGTTRLPANFARAAPASMMHVVASVIFSSSGLQWRRCFCGALAASGVSVRPPRSSDEANRRLDIITDSIR